MPTTWTTVTDIIKLADHKLRHQKSGADEIVVTGLWGDEVYFLNGNIDGGIISGILEAMDYLDKPLDGGAM